MTERTSATPPDFTSDDPTRQNHMLLEQIARLTREQQLLADLRHLLMTQVDLQRIIRAVVEQIAQIYRYSLVSIYLLDEEVLRLQHQTNYPQKIEVMPRTRGVMGRVARTGQAVLLRDADEIVQDADFVAAIEGITGEICVALFDEQRVVGILNIEKTRDLAFNDDDLALMEAVAELLSIAFRHTRLYQEAQQNSQQYQTLLNNLNEIIYQLDSQGNFTFVNAAWQRIMGYTVEETLGTALMAYIHPEDALIAQEGFADFFSHAKPICVTEGRYRAKNGDLLWLLSDARLVESGAGDVWVTGSFIDISKRKRAEASEQQQRLLVDAFSDTAEALTTTLKLEAMLDFVFANLRRVMPPFHAARAMLLHGDDCRIVRAEGYQAFTGSDAIHTMRFPYRQVPRWKQMIETSQAYIIADLTLIPERVSIPNLEWVRSVVGAPLRTNERVIGAIHLDSATPDQFEPIHAEWLQAFADLVGTAIQNAQMYADLSSHASHLEDRVAERTAAFQRAKLQVEKILNTSSDSILLLDEQGRIQQVNPAFTRLTHYEGDSVFGQPLVRFVDAEAVEMLEHSIARALGGEANRLELVMRRHDDDASLSIDAALDPISTYKGDTAIVCTLHDVTERRRIETELRRALEDERRLSELKTRFSITVSHEFRTPLQIIQSSSDKLTRYFSRLSEEGRSEALHNIEAQVHHLKNLLEDIMTISKADTIGMEFEPVETDVGKFIDGIVREMRWVASSRRRIYYTPPTALIAPIDIYLMRRVFNNLLSNAIKYSLDGTAIHVSAALDGETICIEVRDQGIGIPEVDQDKVFEMFHRAENAGSLPGTGLGLAIVKRSVEMHGGTIDFHSRVGQGTTFTIRLPHHHDQYLA